MNSSRTILGIASLSLIFTLGLTACEQDGTAEKAGQKIDRAAENMGEKMNEARDSFDRRAERTGDYLGEASITGKIRAGILSDSSIKVSQLNIDTTNGAVKLSGTVDSQQSIDRITAIAHDVDGVKSVTSDLTVKKAE